MRANGMYVNSDMLSSTIYKYDAGIICGKVM